MTPRMISVVILVLCLSFVRIINGFTCESNLSECETSLVISHYLTMLHPVHKAVYPYKGKLYKYDVNDTSQATPIPVAEVVTADGWESQRLIIVANNTMPGPPIILYEGQKITIHVINHLQSDTVSIHWHGLPQEGTPYMDGVGFVSQCPIQPGSSFTYQFIAKPKGTYWYHSHVGSQRSKGLFGAFVIKSRPEKMDDIEEKIMSIQDWNHDWDADMDHQKMVYGIYDDRKKHSPSRSLDGSYFSLFKVQSGLINGRGRYYDPSTGLHNESPLEIFEVKQGRKYRFRIIATGALYPFRISIDDHNVTMIESDGYNVEPITTDFIIINPGERFDVLIHTDKAVDNYWIRGQTLESNRNHIAEAILRYSGAPDTDPVTSHRICTVDDRCLVINCPFTYYPANEFTDCLRFDHLKSDSSNDPAPPFIAGKFKEYFLNFAFPGTTYTPGSVNGRKFELPSVSAISQPREISTSCEDKDCGEQKLCHCSFTLDIEHGDTVQMIFMNMGKGKGWAHPIHMHGHSFYVLKMGYATYDNITGKIIEENMDIDCRGGTYRNESFCNDAAWSDPSWKNGNIPDVEMERAPRKDTIIVPSGGYVVTRIKADNPGIWIMHCHIELHSTDGMTMLINESFGKIPSVPEGFPTCRSFSYSSPLEKSTQDHLRGMFDMTTFWTVVGVLIVLLFIQFIIILYMCFKSKDGSEKQYSVSYNGKTNPAFTE